MCSAIGLDSTYRVYHWPLAVPMAIPIPIPIVAAARWCSGYGVKGGEKRDKGCSDLHDEN
jgi:hypothetical protein